MGSTGAAGRWRAAAIALLLAVALAFATAGASRAGELTIDTGAGRHVLHVELADDPPERERGLMFRRELAPDGGMLFDFGSSQAVHMWMKNTYIALDMLFIDTEGIVRRIEHNTEPFSLATISSGVPVRFVLEMPAGTARRLGVQPGDRVRHPAIAKP